MLWLGEPRGYLSDWLTQLWVRATGQRMDIAQVPWLDGPTGDRRGIGRNFFTDLAEREGLVVIREGRRGLLRDFNALAAPDFDPQAVDQTVVAFYTHTSDFDLDAWAEWRGVSSIRSASRPTIQPPSTAAQCPAIRPGHKPRRYERGDPAR